MVNYMPKLVDTATYSPGRGRATADQVEAWRSLVRGHAAAALALERSLAPSGLDGSEYDVLFTLSLGAPEGLRPTELAERGLLTKSGITRLLDRLEERALIERRTCPTDRRGHLVALTPAGRRALRRASPPLLRAIARVVGTLSGAELTALRASAERIREAASPDLRV